MGLEDLVSVAKQAIKDGQEQVLDSVLLKLAQDVLASAPQGGGDDDGINQGTVDAAVAAKAAEDAQAMADAQAAHDAQIAALQAALDQAKADGKMSADQIKALQDNISSIQSTFDAFKSAVNAVLNPPAPQPVQPDPAQPQPEEPVQS